AAGGTPAGLPPGRRRYITSTGHSHPLHPCPASHTLQRRHLAGCPEGILPSAAGGTPAGLPPGRRRYTTSTGHSHPLQHCPASHTFQRRHLAGCPEGILPPAAGGTPAGLPPGRWRYTTSTTLHRHLRSPASVGSSAVPRTPALSAATYSASRGWRTSARSDSDNRASVARWARPRAPRPGCLRAGFSQTTFPEFLTSATPHPACRSAPVHWRGHCMADSASSCESAVLFHRNQQSRGSPRTAPHNGQENKFGVRLFPESARARLGLPPGSATETCARLRESPGSPAPYRRPQHRRA